MFIMSIGIFIEVHDAWVEFKPWDFNFEANKRQNHTPRKTIQYILESHKRLGVGLHLLGIYQGVGLEPLGAAKWFTTLSRVLDFPTPTYIFLPTPTVCIRNKFFDICKNQSYRNHKTIYSKRYIQIADYCMPKQFCYANFFFQKCENLAVHVFLYSTCLVHVLTFDCYTTLFLCQSCLPS